MLEENPCPWTRISLYLTGYTKGNYDWLIISFGKRDCVVRTFWWSSLRGV
ncbi:hypothetical protein MnTg02_00645 [bacterium MnTg02]|nr:hypothetical protein MnTg02_00645 [bacterium MnTg02]